MEKELWHNSQLFVNAGLGHLVKHLYIEEFEKNLTQAQILNLGDLSVLIDSFMATKKDMKQLIQGLIYLSNKGVILGPKE